MSEDRNPSPSDVADEARAAEAGRRDGENGTFNPDGKRDGDTPEQQEAYDESFAVGSGQK